MSPAEIAALVDSAGLIPHGVGGPTWVGAEYARTLADGVVALVAALAEVTARAERAETALPAMADKARAFLAAIANYRGWWHGDAAVLGSEDTLQEALVQHGNGGVAVRGIRVDERGHIVTDVDGVELVESEEMSRAIAEAVLARLNGQKRKGGEP